MSYFRFSVGGDSIACPFFARCVGLAIFVLCFCPLYGPGGYWLRGPPSATGRCPGDALGDPNSPLVLPKGRPLDQSASAP